jgi:hypothetical protein
MIFCPKSFDLAPGIWKKIKPPFPNWSSSIVIGLYFDQKTEDVIKEQNLDDKHDMI